MMIQLPKQMIWVRRMTSKQYYDEENEIIDIDPASEYEKED